jgi:hypothetical protein
MGLKAIAEAAKALEYAADQTSEKCRDIFDDAPVNSPVGKLAVQMMAFTTAVALFAERVQKATEEPTA